MFLWFLLVFLFLGFTGIYEEKQGNIYVAKKKMYKQRWVVIGIHLNAFVILTLRKGFVDIDLESLYIGLGMLLFLCIAWMVFDFRFAMEDGFLWNSIFLLLTLSIVLLQRLSPKLAQQQLLWIFISFALVSATPFIFRVIPAIKRMSSFYLITGWILLMLPFFLGEKKGGAMNWVFIRNYGFQPSEFVKIFMILYIASICYKKKSYRQWLFAASMMAGYILVLVLQRDLGGALLYFMTFLTMFYVFTGKEIYFLGGLGLGSLAAIVAYHIFHHVRVRIEVWLNPWQDIERYGYQIAHSLFALGSWGWMGSGLTKGYAGYVPAVTTDFIFTALVEEFGPLFGIGIIIVLIFMLIRINKIINGTEDIFYILLGVGCMSIFGFQSFLILGGVLKMIPLTGVTLPFVSYGGSSMIAMMSLFKIIQWIGIQGNQAEENRGVGNEDYS